ncbi:MAG: VOC family protein [Prevotella sp.]|nr:VOC family protein [Prevotella sp.]
MRIDHAALFCRDLEQMRQFFIDYFDARSNEQYHNPRTGLRTYILSFTEGSTRLELMQRTEQREPSSSLEWPSRDGRRQSQRPDVQDADPSQPTIGYVHLSFAVGSRKGVDLLTRRLAADGYTITSGPRTTGDGYYESSILGPEGIQIEITE